PGGAGEAAALRATGTEGAAVPVQLPASCPPVAQTPDTGCEGLRLAEGAKAGGTIRADGASPIQAGKLRLVEGDCEPLRKVPPAGFEPASTRLEGGCISIMLRGPNSFPLPVRCRGLASEGPPAPGYMAVWRRAPRRPRKEPSARRFRLCR